jgi:hypothetical protein
MDEGAGEVGKVHHAFPAGARGGQPPWWCCAGDIDGLQMRIVRSRRRTYPSDNDHGMVIAHRFPFRVACGVDALDQVTVPVIPATARVSDLGWWHGRLRRTGASRRSGGYSPLADPRRAGEPGGAQKTDRNPPSQGPAKDRPRLRRAGRLDKTRCWYDRQRPGRCLRNRRATGFHRSAPCVPTCRSSGSMEFRLSEGRVNGPAAYGC